MTLYTSRICQGPCAVLSCRSLLFCKVKCDSAFGTGAIGVALFQRTSELSGLGGILSLNVLSRRRGTTWINGRGRVWSVEFFLLLLYFIIINCFNLLCINRALFAY